MALCKKVVWITARCLNRMQAQVNGFSIAANVCAADSAMILHTVPNWLRVFDSRLSEVLLVVDELPASGRIAHQHKGLKANEDLYAAIRELQDLDARIRYVVLDYSTVTETSERWFSESSVVRCQSGTPIFAFVRAIEEAACEIVLRTDSDMLFFDGGWLNKAVEFLESEAFDLVEPPKLGMTIHGYTAVSTRAFLVRRSRFAAQCLPLKSHRLDWARRFHRALDGRPSWLSLEQTLEKEKDRGRVKHALLDSRLGFSVHVFDREVVHSKLFAAAVSMIEAGQIPEAQLSEGWNLVLDKWPKEFFKRSALASNQQPAHA